MSSGRRIDVSSVQVVASVMAAVTGALAASFLGVAGTIIGTAMMSVAGTVGVAVYRYFLDRSREKIHSAASAKMPPSARASSVPAVLSRHHQVTQPSRTQPGSQAYRADEAETQVLPALGGTWSDWPDDTRTRNSASVTGQHGTGRHATGRHGSGQHDGGRADAVNGLGLGSSWRDFPAWLRSSTRQGRARWKNLAGAVLIVFVLAIACITVIEVLVGKPLAAVVSNQPGTGTSISHVLAGPNSAPAHSRSPAPGSSSSSSPASGHSATSSPSTSVPASSSASPTPAATDSPAHSPSPNVSASATPTASPSPPTQHAGRSTPGAGPGNS
jgi:cell division septation protein DedD